MGSCQNCGHTAWGLSTVKCRNCGKEICDNCRTYLFKLWEATSSNLIDVWYACSQECLHDFASQIEKHVSAVDVGISRSAIDSVPSIVGKTLLKLEHEEYLGKEFLKLKSEAKPFRVNFAPFGDFDDNPKGNILWERLEKNIRLIVIQNLITARNFERAAKLYEEMGMYEAAGKTRALDKGDQHQEN